MKVFEPSATWSQVPEGAVVPPGCEIRMDLANGKTYARLRNGAPAESPEPQSSEPQRSGRIDLAAAIGEAESLWRAGRWRDALERYRDLLTRRLREAGRTPLRSAFTAGDLVVIERLALGYDRQPIEYRVSRAAADTFRYQIEIS